MNTKLAARFAFRWMMAIETGDKSWHTADPAAVDAVMDAHFGHIPFDAGFHRAVLDECRQWVPTLYDEHGEMVDWERQEQAKMKASGTVGTVGHREACQRCGGLGGWSGWPGFTCYRCGGKDSQRFEWIPTKVYTQAGLERTRASRERAERKRQEKAAAALQAREARLQEWANESADHEDLLTVLGSYAGSNAFIRDLAHRALVRVLPLSGAQVQAAWRALKQDERAQAAAASSRHVGDRGQRLEMWVRVAFVKDLDGGQFGPTRLVRMEDVAGNVFVTFSSAGWVWDVEQGQELVLRATVKDHQEYQGVQQTVLTRCKVVPEASV